MINETGINVMLNNFSHASRQQFELTSCVSHFCSISVKICEVRVSKELAVTKSEYFSST